MRPPKPAAPPMPRVLRMLIEVDVSFLRKLIVVIIGFVVMLSSLPEYRITGDKYKTVAEILDDKK
jgi:hypothetical protein